MKKVRLLAAVMFAAASFACHAANVRWYLDGITFDDGGTAHGWFDEDPGAGTFGRFVIYTTDGTSIAGHDYVDGQASASRYVAIGNSVPTEAFARSGPWQLRFRPTADLTAAGGPTALDLSDTNNNVECNNCSAFRVITAGQLIGVTDLLFGGGFDD